MNPANTSLLSGGGVNGAIHRAAGPKLLDECRKLGGCEVGKAKLTKGYKLPARHIIHTVGPVWSGGKNNEPKLLRSCYKECLSIAAENKFDSIAFPLISSGASGYPKDQALKIAVDSCSEFLKIYDMDITIVIFDRESFDIGRKKLKDIQAFIDDNYFDESRMWGYSAAVGTAFSTNEPFRLFRKKASNSKGKARSAHSSFPAIGGTCIEGIEAKLKMIDESFTEMLLRKIDEKGMTDSDCYKKANIDRKLFSKIRSNKNYHPKKVTAVAFAIALELDIDETKELLLKAGFGLSNSSKFDIIVRYFIESGNYNIYEINEALFQFDQAMGLLSAFQSQSEEEITISRPHSVWCCDWKLCVSAYHSCRICSSVFLLLHNYSIDNRRDLLSMYLPQETQKSFTAALFALGGVVSRPATDVVKNGSQIAYRFSIT